MTTKKYKTVKRLEKIWNHIDNILSEVNLAYEELLDMSVNDESTREILYKLELIDLSTIVSIKNKLEEEIELKKQKGDLS